MRPILLLSVVLASAACGACERKIAESNLRTVKPDMTTKEVESILGTPNRVKAGPELVSREVKTLPVTRYVYEQNGEKFELTFVGDRLAEGPIKGIPSIEGKIGK